MLTMPLANGGWPSLFMMLTYYAPFAVVVGLLIEWAAFYRWLHWSWRKALGAALVANAVSAGVGAALLPLLGMGFESISMALLGPLMGWIGPIVALPALVALPAAMNVCVEYWILVWPFRAPRTWHTLGVLFVANLMSVIPVFLGMALAEGLFG